MRTLKALLAASMLLTLIACGGGGGGGGSSTPTPATRLVYTDPTDATAYRWVRDAGLSTNTHLVLDLVAPVGVNLHGIGFHATVDATRAGWSKVASGDATWIQNAAFSLGSGTQALAAKVSGNALQAGVYQKAVSTTPVASSGQPLVRVALDLTTGATPGTISLQQTSGKALALVAGTTVAAGNVTTAFGSLQAQ